MLSQSEILTLIDWLGQTNLLIWRNENNSFEIWNATFYLINYIGSEKRITINAILVKI